MIVRFDYSKLRGRITEKFGTQTKFASKIGKTDANVSNILNGWRDFSQPTIILWAEALDIPPEEYGSYFFAIQSLD